MSYGYSLPDAYRQTARLVVTILKGDRPSDLPFELPAEYELVVNLKAAKAITLIFWHTITSTSICACGSPSPRLRSSIPALRRFAVPSSLDSQQHGPPAHRHSTRTRARRS